MRLEEESALHENRSVCRESNEEQINQRVALKHQLEDSWSDVITPVTVDLSAAGGHLTGQVRL